MGNACGYRVPDECTFNRVDWNLKNVKQFYGESKISVRAMQASFGYSEGLHEGLTCTQCNLSCEIDSWESGSKLTP